MSGYVLSADADLDLDAIWEYIAADNIAAADRWVGKPLKLSDKHREWATGVRISPPIRSCSGLSELIFIYRAERRPIEIIAVTQGSRDIPAFLSRRVSHS